MTKVIDLQPHIDKREQERLDKRMAVHSCPIAEQITRDAIRKATEKEPAPWKR